MVRPRAHGAAACTWGSGLQPVPSDLGWVAPASPCVRCFSQRQAPPSWRPVEGQPSPPSPILVGGMKCKAHRNLHQDGENDACFESSHQVRIGSSLPLKHSNPSNTPSMPGPGSSLIPTQDTLQVLGKRLEWEEIVSVSDSLLVREPVIISLTRVFAPGHSGRTMQPGIPFPTQPGSTEAGDGVRPRLAPLSWQKAANSGRWLEGFYWL